jgi:hypothetical protein
MQIVCATDRAAAQVLVLLLNAGFQPLYHYRIGPISASLPPITVTPRLHLPNLLLDQIRNQPDTTVIIDDLPA